MSFYSPHIENEIKNFVINKIYSTLESLGEDIPQFVIIGGDTNTVFSDLDKQGGRIRYKYNAIHAFEKLTKRFSLIDIFRVKHPYQREFTWETLNPDIIQERIDIFHSVFSEWLFF